MSVLCLRFLGGALSTIHGRITNLHSTGTYSWQLPAQFINLKVAPQYNPTSKHLATLPSSNHVASRTGPRCTSRKLHSLPPRHPPHWTRQCPSHGRRPALSQARTTCLPPPASSCSFCSFCSFFWFLCCSSYFFYCCYCYTVSSFCCTHPPTNPHTTHRLRLKGVSPWSSGKALHLYDTGRHATGTCSGGAL